MCLSSACTLVWERFFINKQKILSFFLQFFSTGISRISSILYNIKAILLKVKVKEVFSSRMERSVSLLATFYFACQFCIHVLGITSNSILISKWHVFFVIFVCLPHTFLSLEKKSDVKHRNLLSWPNFVLCDVPFWNIVMLCTFGSPVFVLLKTNCATVKTYQRQENLFIIIMVLKHCPRRSLKLIAFCS